MTVWTKLLCYSFRNAGVWRKDFSRTIFSIKKRYLVPRTPEGFSLDEFKVFYHFPGIRLASALGRLKYFKAAIGVGVSCVSYVSYETEIIPKDACIVFILTAICSTVGLFATTYLCNNLIGKMYANKGSTEIVLSYINTRGQRINKTFKKGELLLSEHPNNLARKYLKQVICHEKDLKFNLYCKGRAKFDFITFCKIFPNFE